MVTVTCIVSVFSSMFFTVKILLVIWEKAAGFTKSRVVNFSGEFRHLDPGQPTVAQVALLNKPFSAMLVDQLFKIILCNKLIDKNQNSTTHCTLWNQVSSPSLRFNNCIFPLYMNRNAWKLQRTLRAYGSLTADRYGCVWSCGLGKNYKNMHSSETAAALSLL